MINVDLTNIDTSILTDVFSYFASQPAYFAAPGFIGSDKENAYNVPTPGGAGYLLRGTGFQYDANGFLIAGTINAISAGSSGPPDDPTEGFSSGVITGLSFPVSELLLLAPTLNPAPAILAGNETVVANSATVTTYGGDDTIQITGGGTKGPSPFDPVPNTIDVNAGAGVNSVDLSATFRDEGTLIGGGGNEVVQVDGAYAYLTTATLTSVDKIEFIDGATYENNATPDSQAALMFLGVFGRVPDAINAGGFGQLAVRDGRLAAANAMLATQEGSADTAGLTNTAFVTRLYNNMLDRAPDPTGLAGWVNDLNTGLLGRGDVVERFAGSPEAQTVNANLFASGQVFGADPAGVEVLRAYTTILGRLPEASSLSGNIVRLEGGLTLQDFYSEIQHSAEFAADGGNRDGITVNTPYDQVYATLHDSAVTNYVLTLVNPATGISHQAG